MKQYYKIINGKTIWFDGRIVLGDKQIFNPTEDKILAAGYQIYVPEPDPEPSAEQLLAEAIENKVAEIEDYDTSTDVDECYIQYQGQTIPYWGNKTDRASLQKAVENHIAQRLSTYRLDLREYGVSIDIDCAVMLDMLQKLEVYASQCYNKTSDHIFAVRLLTDTESVESYDYTVGYPNKLTFEL